MQSALLQKGQAGGQRRCACCFRPPLVQGGRVRFGPTAMLNPHHKAHRLAGESWHRIRLSLRNWSRTIPISRSLSCAMRSPTLGACGCNTPPSRTCCPGSASHTKKSLVATERRRAKVRHQRADWFEHRRPVIATLPDCVVFIHSRQIAAQSPVRQWMKRL